LEYRTFAFSGGEIQVRLDLRSFEPIKIVIDADLRSAHDIMELFLVTNALRHRYPDVRTHLLCKYLPYARQDRVCSPGEAFSLEAICHLFNVQRYDSITLWDVHSQKSLDLLHRAFNVLAVDLIPESIIGDSVLVSPDKGAIDRVALCAERFRRPMIVADKIRNPDTGAIIGTKICEPDMEAINEKLINCDGGFLMIDDICDGGKTFIELAKVLRPLTSGRIGLYVTHMIASQGFAVFDGLIDYIHTANCFKEDVPDFVQIGNQTS
jgi:ribose-phosphate pyrophosphokinase